MTEGRSVLMDVSWAFERDHATSSVRLHSFPRGRKGASRSDESMALAPDQTNLVHHAG